MKMDYVEELSGRNRIVVDLTSNDKHATNVNFLRGNVTHTLRLDWNCSPLFFSQLLAKAMQMSSGDFGLFVAEFIRGAGNTIKVSLLPPGQEDEDVSYVYNVITFGGPVTTNVQVVEVHSSGRKVVFLGSIHRFNTWVQEYRASSDLRGKLIKFYYQGGTVAGNRIVKVDEVQSAGDNYLIRGKDVMKEEFRSFRLDKIQGDIILVS